jgi:hypothetical protein
MEKNKKPYSAASFDSFSHVCPFFTSRTDVNNGYGCLHTNQEEYEVRDDGIKRGKCYCWSCPLGISADDESLLNPNVDWDGDDVQSGDVDGEYLLVKTDDSATEDEKRAWFAYQHYINRYNR